MRRRGLRRGSASTRPGAGSGSDPASASTTVSAAKRLAQLSSLTHRSMDVARAQVKPHVARENVSNLHGAAPQTT